MTTVPETIATVGGQKKKSHLRETVLLAGPRGRGISTGGLKSTSVFAATKNYTSKAAHSLEGLRHVFDSLDVKSLIASFEGRQKRKKKIV